MDCYRRAPPAVDAATIVGDAMKACCRNTGKADIFNREHPKAMSELNNMYVTSKDIDETVKRLSFTIPRRSTLRWILPDCLA